MASVKAGIASDSWVLSERKLAVSLVVEEAAELLFPAANQIQWLNEHISDLLSIDKFIKAFKTPGKLRGARTPAFKHTATRPRPKDAFAGVAHVLNAHVEILPEPTPQNVAPPVAEAVPEPAQEIEPQEEEDQEPTPTPQSPPVQLHTDSEFGSPSVHATPERPLRKTSFSYAPLPARDPLRQSQNARPSEVAGPSSAAIPTTRQESLGLSSNASDESDPITPDLRAPELIAYDQRLQQYASPSPQAESSSSRPTSSSSSSSSRKGKERARFVAPGQDEIMEDDMPGASPDFADMFIPISDKENANVRPMPLKPKASTELEELEELYEAEEPEEPQPTSSRASKAPAREPAPIKTKPRLTSTKLRGGPIRNVPKPPPVPIKIKSAMARPMNIAPVAAHNQDTVRKENQRPEPVRKPSSQSGMQGSSRIQKKSKPVPSKALTLAQKKKLLDEEAAAKDAAIKQQQKERRDNKIEELRRQKIEEELEKDRNARENSAEKHRRHLTEVDARPEGWRKSEERQKRDEAAAAQKKTDFKKQQQERQIKAPAKKPIPAIPSLRQPAIIPRNTATQGVARPQNPPPRPPARLDHHDLPEEQPEELPAYPNNLSRPPVRGSSIRQPSIFTNTSTATNPSLQQFPAPPARVAPQMQQYATQRIPFANEVPQHHQPQHLHQSQQLFRPQTQAGPSMNTPFAPMRSMQTIQAIQNSTPMTEMSLPEIHTDSSDDSDRVVELPSWATPGHVFNTLSQQETVNPDQIFPRIPTISMDDVFAENPDRLRRLRMRTSSANWIRNGDALTQVEVIEDRIGRQAIRNAGGWFTGWDLMSSNE